MIDVITEKNFVELPDIMLDKSKSVKYIQLLSEQTIDSFYYSNLRKDLESIFSEFRDSKYFINYQGEFALKSNASSLELSRFSNAVQDKIGNYIEKKIDLSIWSKNLYNILIGLSEQLNIREAIYLTSTFFEGKTEEEISEILDISRKTMYRIKKSCLVKLRIEFLKYNLMN